MCSWGTGCGGGKGWDQHTPPAEWRARSPGVSCLCQKQNKHGTLSWAQKNPQFPIKPCELTWRSCVRKGRSDSRFPHWHPNIPPGPRAGSLQSFWREGGQTRSKSHHLKKKKHITCKPPVLPVALGQILNVFVCHLWVSLLYNDIRPDDTKAKKLKFYMIFHGVFFPNFFCSSKCEPCMVPCVRKGGKKPETARVSVCLCDRPTCRVAPRQRRCRRSGPSCSWRWTQTHWWILPVASVWRCWPACDDLGSHPECCLVTRQVTKRNSCSHLKESMDQFQSVTKCSSPIKKKKIKAHLWPFYFCV